MSVLYSQQVFMLYFMVRSFMVGREKGSIIPLTSKERLVSTLECQQTGGYLVYTILCVSILTQVNECHGLTLV